MALGLVPCFETSDLFTKRYMPHVISYHLDNIFKSMLNETEKKVYILCDELTHICSDAPGEQNVAYKSLVEIATRGRKLGIGLLYATQNYSKVPRKIKSNTDYVFAFSHSNEMEVNLIKKDFDMKNIEKKEILGLKTLEVIGITKEHFVCYKNGKKWNTPGPIKGIIIPPQSNHYGEGEEC